MRAFEDRVCFVTGANSGLGAALTEALLDAGALVVGADIDVSGFERFRRFGDAFRGCRADVTIEQELESGVGEAVAVFGRLDCAFNVAGVSRGRPIVDLDEELWDFNVDRVLKGVFLSLKHEARAMRTAGKGTIVNVSSLNARVPMYSGAAYSSGKAGVEMLTRTAALEFAPWNVRVNSVLPGLIDTPLTQRRLRNPSLMRDWLARIPLGRPGLPSEVAAVCMFLAGDSASYVTGTSVVVDGGWENSTYPDLAPYTEQGNEKETT